MFVRLLGFSELDNEFGVSEQYSKESSRAKDKSRSTARGEKANLVTRRVI